MSAAMLRGAARAMSSTPSSPMPWNKLRGAPAHRRPPPSDTAVAAGAVGSDLLLPAPMPMPPAVDVSPAALLDAAAALFAAVERVPGSTGGGMTGVAGGAAAAAADRGCGTVTASACIRPAHRCQ